jgi:hypothetical protein
MSKPHANKPFPLSMYENAKIKPRHIFVFDLLCRHFDAEDDNWIFTNSLDIIRLFHKINGFKIETVTPILNMLKQYGYIELIHNIGYRSVDERRMGKTDYEIKISDSAWEPKERVRAASLEAVQAYRNRGAERKAKLQALN